MPAYGVAIEKEMPAFRGSPERFANVWHYRIAVPVEADYENLALAVAAGEKTIYGADMQFKSARVFGPTEGSKENNLMRAVIDLTGAGTHGYVGTACYPELTAVVSRYVGRSPVKNRKVFVRKYFRLTKMMSAGDNVATGALTTGTRDEFENLFEAMRSITRNAVSFTQVTPKDVEVPAGNPAVCLPYAHIRQIRQ